MKMKPLIALLVAVGISGWFCGCKTLTADRKYILHDTVYEDYYTDDGWSKTRSEAKLWRYSEAKRWLDDYRTNERGEYADTGPTDYPVQIEAK